MADVATAFRDAGARSAKNAEQITQHTVEMVFLVHDRLAHDPAALEVLEVFEEAYGTRSAFNSILKLGIISKLKDQPTRIWALEALRDMVQNHLLHNEDITKVKLAGDRHGSLLKLLEFKQLLLHHFLQKELPRNTFCMEDRELMQKHLANHRSYRATVAAAGDVTWQGQLKLSSLEALRLIEDWGPPPPPPPRPNASAFLQHLAPTNSA